MLTDEAAVRHVLLNMLYNAITDAKKGSIISVDLQFGVPEEASNRNTRSAEAPVLNTSTAVSDDTLNKLRYLLVCTVEYKKRRTA